MAENGNKRKVYLVENTTNTYVVGQTSGGFSLNDELLDASDKTHEWAEYISGKKAWSATIGVNLDNTASSMQIKFLESLVGGTKVKVFIGVLDADKQSDGILGEAFVASVEDTFDNSAISSRSITLTGTGAAIIVKPA
jgi:hypothetical protein